MLRCGLDTVIVVNTDLVDNQTISIRVKYDARLGREFILLDALYDPKNEKEFGRPALAYWENVDLYIGGNEHATGHLFPVLINS
jgi:leucyl-tRNA synthetase